jgi:hypothetical protein
MGTAMSIMCGLLNLVHAILLEAMRLIPSHTEKVPRPEAVPEATPEAIPETESPETTSTAA